MSESFSDKAKRAASRALDEAERRYAAPGDRDGGSSAGRDSDGRSSTGGLSTTDRLVQKAKEAASEVLDRAQDRGERFADKAGRATSDVVDRTVGSLDTDDEGTGVAAFVRRNARRRPVVTVVAAVLVGVAVGKTISR